MPKANGKVRLCLDLAHLNQALIRPIHRGLTLNDILLKLNSAKYLSLLDVSSGYHNLKLDKKNHLTSQCLHASLEDTDTNGYHFGAAPAGDMFQWKIDEIFKDMPKYLALWMIY